MNYKIKKLVTRNPVTCNLKKILLFTVLAVFAIAGCKEKEEPTPTKPKPPPTNVYEAFKADTTLRWESGTTVQKSEDSDYIFIIDADGELFESAKYKIGRMSFDGDSYELIEFSGTPAVGKPTSPTIRKLSGTTTLNSLEIIKIDDGKLWIVFKETASSPERRIVQ